jgi:predicted ABC-type ATPase
MEKYLYIIAGCNGAGKTTASYTILPDILNCKEFVNADEIAKGLSPFQPEKVAFESGRIMLQRINDLIEQNQSFAFETTLATKSYQSKINYAKGKNYKIVLLFFWLQNTEIAIERVKSRVLEGGHHVAEDIIIRRYHNGINNLFNIYFSIVDELLIFDNSEGKLELICSKKNLDLINIVNQNKFNKLKSYHISHE